MIYHMGYVLFLTGFVMELVFGLRIEKWSIAMSDECHHQKI